MTVYAVWRREFEAERGRRAERGDPDWAAGARMNRAVIRSVQRFQLGESSDGAGLIAKAAATGDVDYAESVRLFVAEERNHARQLQRLLHAAGAPTIARHWSDTVFVLLRRALGLRLELMVLFIAEIVALRYYRALRDGSEDPLVRDVGGRILADEQRHIPFHCRRLRDELGVLRPGSRALVTTVWRLLARATIFLVALDHGPALRALSVSRREFARDTTALFDAAIMRIADTTEILPERQPKYPAAKRA